MIALLRQEKRIVSARGSCEDNANFENRDSLRRAGNAQQQMVARNGTVCVEAKMEKKY